MSRRRSEPSLQNLSSWVLVGLLLVVGSGCITLASDPISPPVTGSPLSVGADGPGYTAPDEDSWCQYVRDDRFDCDIFGCNVDGSQPPAGGDQMDGTAGDPVSPCEIPGTDDGMAEPLPPAIAPCGQEPVDPVEPCSRNDDEPDPVPEPEPVPEPVYITICHLCNTPAQQTIVVPESEVTEHLQHGDQLGICPVAEEEEEEEVPEEPDVPEVPEDDGSPCGAEEEEVPQEPEVPEDDGNPCDNADDGDEATGYPPVYVTICHLCDTPDQITMVVLSSEVPEHMAHGDSIGACLALDRDRDFCY